LFTKRLAKNTQSPTLTQLQYKLEVIAYYAIAVPARLKRSRTVVSRELIDTVKGAMALLSSVK